MAIKEGWAGRYFEDFEVGDIYRHRLGRTVTATDNIWFTNLTMNNNPSTSTMRLQQSRDSDGRLLLLHSPLRW